SQLAEKRAERQPPSRLRRRDLLVRFHVRAASREDALEDALLQRREVRRDRAEPLTPVAMAEPIGGEVADDGDEPGGEAGAVAGLGEIATEASEIVGPQGCAHLREHVHHFVVLRRVVPDRGEDEAAVTLDEEVPGAVGISRLELSGPLEHAATPTGPARI